MPDSPQDSSRPTDDREAARRRFELARDLAEGPMAVLSVLAIALVVLELAVELPPAGERLLQAGLWLTWGAFAIEYLFFLALAPDKGKYFRGNLFGLLTVLLPFLRVFRVLRALRAARALRALRAANLTRRNAVRLRGLLQWSAFAYVAAVAALITLVSAAAAVALEAGVEGAVLVTYSQALWWAFGAMSTIGTSLEPVTPEGRLLAVPLYLMGPAVQAYFGGVIAASLIGQLQEDARDAERAGAPSPSPLAGEGRGEGGRA